ncbi:MAG TPA: YebC/PmpR family DNA-binding transcriptional regulator [Chloroflexia bacterium]|nr:YebC/PmpR family DNA-binding transcriptional regulator [Chloroflexia bacterium]
MSGHSKWATIKRKKGAADARRGQLFTKLAREIQVAAREGGGDPESNFRLRLAVQKARTENMPQDNIQRAIQRGAGTGGDGAHFEEVMYEGYGPNGVAFIVQTLTDNRNRTVSEVRSIFTKAGGSLGESGSVAWMFEPRGLIFVEPKPGDDTDELSLAAIDAGAEDVMMEEDQLEVVTAFQDLKHVQDQLALQGMQIANAETTMVPKTTMTLEEKGVEQTIRLIEKLEELDDVQTVYTNLDLTGAEELIESMS